MIPTTKSARVIVGAWLLIVAGWAFHYVTSALATNPSDEYASSHEFQLLMFAIFRLPWLAAALVAALLIARRPGSAN